MVSYDTIIRNGRWFDGTGAPSAVRNIGIRDGHVVAITAARPRRHRLPPGHRRDRQVGVARHARHPHPLRRRGARRPVAGGVAAPRRDHRDARIVFAVDRPRRRRGRRRSVRPGRGDSPRTRHRRRRPAQDLDELPRSTSQRSRRGRSAPTSRPSSATPTCAPRRWGWIVPPGRSSGRPRANRPRWSGCSPRRCRPASSECPRSNCFSTSSTVRSAARAPCRRPMPSRANCAGSSRCCGAAGRILQSGPDIENPLNLGSQLAQSLGIFRNPLKTSLLSAADVKSNPYAIRMHGPAGAAGQPPRRQLPLAAPAGAVRGLRRRHRPGGLRGVRRRRRRTASARRDGAQRADARRGVSPRIPQGVREQVRRAGVAPRLLRRRDRRLPRRRR